MTLVPLKITLTATDAQPFAQTDEERELQEWLAPLYDRAWESIGFGSGKEKPPFLVLDDIGMPYYDGTRVCIPTEVAREARAGNVREIQLFSGAHLDIPSDIQLEEAILHEFVHHTYEHFNEGLTTYASFFHLARMYPEESASCIAGKIGMFVTGALAEGDCHVRSLDEMTLPWNLPSWATAAIQREIDAFYNRPDEVRQRYETMKNSLRIFCVFEAYCRQLAELLVDPPASQDFPAGPPPLQNV